jgi:hypothetical protein
MKRTRIALTLFIATLIATLGLLPTLTVQADFGTNWTATFFNTTNLTGTSQTIGGIAAINFNWLATAPTGLPAAFTLTNCTPTNPPIVDTGTSADCSNFFSVRFTSTQTITPGTYNFVVTSDDGIRVFINNVPVLDKYVGRVLTTDTFTQTITTPTVTITVEYFEGLDQSSVQFQWFLVGSTTPVAGTTVPGVTPTPIATAIPPLTVTVNGAKGLSLRSGPYLGASLVGVVRPGTAYSPTARNRDEGQYDWYQINVDGKVGWASGRYLTGAGDASLISAQTTIFEQLDDAPDTGVIAVPRSIMNLRRRPSDRTETLVQIPWGAELPLLNRTIQYGKDYWYQVRYDGKVGWIYAPFVGVRGDINLVPIR